VRCVALPRSWNADILESSAYTTQTRSLRNETTRSMSKRACVAHWAAVLFLKERRTNEPRTLLPMERYAGERRGLEPGSREPFPHRASKRQL